MNSRWVLVSFTAAMGAMATAGSWAQQPASPFPDPSIYDPRIYNEELTPRQIQRAQEPDPAPAPAQNTPAPKAKAAPKQPPQPAHAVACGGVFAKDSSHLKLATLYKSDNVVFSEVDSGDSKKLMASVLFPKDPKRRLEVWWQNEAARLGVHLIVINGQSTWTAPKGVRLGLQLAALERLNGKPFKLKGVDKDNIAPVSDWQGGALGTLAGGCKLGVFLRPDPKTPPEARDNVPAAAEFASNDTAVKAIKPTVAEIIIGY